MASEPKASALYHLRPDPLIGATLWPLSSLAELSRPLYEEAMRRYDDRPGLVERPVEPLGCAWSDCVFLTPVHPGQLLNAARRGRPSWPQREWLVIDTAALDLGRAVLYTPRRWPDQGTPPPITAADCEPCTPQNLLAASEITAQTVSRLSQSSNRLALFLDVVHVLHRGPLAVDLRRTICA